MLQGTLLQQEDKWIVALSSPDDFTLGTDIFNIHPQHKFWLQIWGEENMETCFVLNENKQAILKACGPDTHQYIQD